MRYTEVEGLDDDLGLNLGSNVSIICEVMKIGTAKDPITFEAVVSGEELIEFFKKFNIDKKYQDQVKKENRYLLTAYDW